MFLIMIFTSTTKKRNKMKLQKHISYVTWNRNSKKSE